MGDKAGFWERVSTGRQSTEPQRPRLQAWSDDRGYEVATRYTMRGKSASKGEHAAMLDQVVADMAAGVITVLVVVRSNRIERRGIHDMFGFMERVIQAGGRVEFVDEPHLNDLTGITGEIGLAVAASLAKAETQTRNQAVADGRAQAVANGGVLTTPPWGYRVTGPKHRKRFEPTPEGREWVPVVFRLAQRMSMARVKAELAGTPLGGRSVPALISMVRNPTYLGRILDKEGRQTGTCEPLVDAATWRKANDALNNRPRSGGRQKGAERALLSGVAECAECGSAMHRNTSGKNNEFSYYRCSDKACGNGVRADKLESAVDAFMTQNPYRVLTPTVIPGTDHAAEIEEVRFQLRQVALADLDDTSMDAELARLRAERDRLMSLPATPTRVEWTESDQTYGDLWNALKGAERGSWLRSRGIRVVASRASAAIVQDGHPEVGEPFGFQNRTDETWSEVGGRLGWIMPLS